MEQAQAIIIPNEQRTVVLYSHGGGKAGKAVFKTNATTFGELKRELTNYVTPAELNYNNNRIIEGNSKVSFETDQAVLPTNIPTKVGITNDLVIIITPKQNIKSGMSSLSRTECYAKIKEAITANGEVAKKFFTKDGKHYTNLPTDVLQKLVVSYDKKHPAAVTKPASKVAAKTTPTKATPAQATPAVKSSPAKQEQVKSERPVQVPGDMVVSEHSLQLLREGITTIKAGIDMVANAGFLYVSQADLSEDELRKLSKI